MGEGGGSLSTPTLRITHDDVSHIMWTPARRVVRNHLSGMGWGCNYCVWNSNWKSSTYPMMQRHFRLHSYNNSNIAPNSRLSKHYKTSTPNSKLSQIMWTQHGVWCATTWVGWAGGIILVNKNNRRIGELEANIFWFSRYDRITI